VPELIIVNGGSGGIGRETARRLVERGARVAIVARDEARLAEAASASGATPYVCDVLDAPAYAETVERIERDLGETTGLVHAVGSIVLKPLHALSVDDFRATLEINTVSAFVALKAVIPKLMRRRRGSIVLFSTVAARMGLQNHEAIAAAKGAIEAMVRSAAISYARYGLRVNAIAPALTKTPLSQSLWSSEPTLQASVAMHPLGRIGEPGDIASAAVFLLSEEAAWLTGQTIGIDGGLGVGQVQAKTTL